MSVRDVVVGETYVYYPPKENIEDNRHWPAKVLKVGNRIQVQLTLPEGCGTPVRYVSAKRLMDQATLL